MDNINNKDLLKLVFLVITVYLVGITILTLSTSAALYIMFEVDYSEAVHIMGGLFVAATLLFFTYKGLVGFKKYKKIIEHYKVKDLTGNVDKEQ